MRAKRPQWRPVVLAAAFGSALVLTPVRPGDPSTEGQSLLRVTTAEAQYGTSRRVARRTSRRTSARHSGGYGYGYGAVGVGVTYGAVAAGAAWVTGLPTGCTAVAPGGVTYHHCGSTYYRPYMHGDQVVYVVEDPD